MFDDDDDGPDSNDELFDELDALVDSSREVLENQKPGDLKNIRFKAKPEIIGLMMEEALLPSEDISVLCDSTGSWVAVVKYHGIYFTCNAGKILPESWEEFIMDIDDEDDEDKDDDEEYEDN